MHYDTAGNPIKEIVLCLNPQCQTTAGCQCSASKNVVCPHGSTYPDHESAMINCGLYEKKQQEESE